MATKKQHTPPVAVEDPKFELAEKAGTYVLRLGLPGFRKDDFRVQVDGVGRITIGGTRTGTAGPGSLHKVFQLPSAANHDNITGRFEAGMLTLTVPKRASSSATAPTSIEEMRPKQPPGMAKETKPNEEGIAKENALKKKQEEEGKKERRKSPAVKEEVKPKAPQAATAPPQETAPVKKEEEMKPKAPQASAASTTMPPPKKPSPTPEADSLAERVTRHGEEECAKDAAVAAEKEAKAEQEKEATANSSKKRAMGELKGLTNMKWAEGLTDMKWADGVVEAARNNKEVIAVCIAAFSVGFLVSQKLFRK